MFDEQHYRDLPVDILTRKEIVNSHGYLYRAKWINKWIKSGSILDLGCNNGILSLRYAYNGWRTVGVDLSKKAIKFCNDFLARFEIDDAEYIQSSIEDFTTKERFDNIFLCEVIEHVADPIKVIEVAEKHLKPNGIIFVTTPDYYGPYGINNEGDKDGEHLRIYKAKELKELFEQRGKILDFRKRQLIYCAYQPA